MAIVVAAAVAVSAEGVICRFNCAIFNENAKVIYGFEITSVSFNLFFDFRENT
jgi:hypothetical protein